MPAERPTAQRARATSSVVVSVSQSNAHRTTWLVAFWRRSESERSWPSHSRPPDKILQTAWGLSHTLRLFRPVPSDTVQRFSLIRSRTFCLLRLVGRVALALVSNLVVDTIGQQCTRRTMQPRTSV